jgi:Hypothetical glycosyl hydrolase family 15
MLALRATGIKARPSRLRALLALTALASCGALISPGIGAAAVAQHFCLVLDTPATVSNPQQTAQRNSYVVLQAWEAARAAQLKAANPELSVLVYQNLSSMAEGTNRDGLSSSGVNFAEATTAHPDWFLEDAKGKRIAEQAYPWLWMADIGNPGYQRQWTANVLRTLASGPWDGVFMDDTNATARFHVDPPSKIAEYPTDAAYQAAVRSMLAYAGPRIIAAGKLAIPNMGAWHEYPEVVEEWLRFVSGGMDQQFVKWSTARGKGYAPAAVWRRQLREIQTTERMGKRFLAVTSAAAGDNRARRYGWASALLGADGHTAFFAANPRRCDAWSSEYGIRLGAPQSPMHGSPDGIWRRRFANGLVVVNPTLSTLPVDFHGVYGGDSLIDARGTTMKPHTALVLVRSTGHSERR